MSLKIVLSVRTLKIDFNLNQHNDDSHIPL